MGLVVTTDDKGVMVYRKDKVSKAGNPYSMYTIKFSSKDASGEWQSAFQDVGFKKGVSVNNKATIKINNAFFVPNNYGEISKSKLIITDFEVIDAGEAPSEVSGDGFMDIPDTLEDELPFA